MQCSPLSCSIHPFLVQISDGDLCRDLITGMDCEFVMNYDAWGEVSNLVTSSPLTRLISRSHAGRTNRFLISRSTSGDRRYAPSIPRHSPAHTAFLYHQDQFWWVFLLYHQESPKNLLYHQISEVPPHPGGRGCLRPYRLKSTYSSGFLGDLTPMRGRKVE